MNEYEAIAVYAVFAFVIFALAMIWRRYRETMKKRFHLLNYRSKSDDSKTAHPV
jgi:hypothetical protein